MKQKSVTLSAGLAEKRQELTEILHAGVATVEFTKVNGERRVMPCTLKAELLPPAGKPLTEGKVERKENEQTLRVFCTDKQSWRSFRIDGVLSVTLTAQE
jgi:hypothetical protein